jgi:SHS2 domain-containing protein
MNYRYLDDIAIADAAFEAVGEDLPSLFKAAAAATMHVMVDPPSAIEGKTSRKIRLADEELDLLLFQFLQELIYYKDAEDLLLRVPEIAVEKGEGGYVLEATARGEHRDPERHRLVVDVKAVTLHRLRVKRVQNGWEATVVLDV